MLLYIIPLYVVSFVLLNVHCNVDVTKNMCTEVVVTIYPNGESTNEKIVTFCEEDCDKNPMLNDMLCFKLNLSSECTFFDKAGVEMETCSDISSTLDRTLFAVPEEKIFVFPPFEVGHKTVLSHIKTPISETNPVVIETLSVSPRVFRLLNYITEEESDALIATAKAQTDPQHILRRSSVGDTGYTVSSHRTSENAFDTTSPTSDTIKKRGFNLLAIRPFDETFADGIQILRYSPSEAYVPHLDYLDIGDRDHDYDSARHGTNRFATVFLYLTNVEEGGETVFVNKDRDYNENDEFNYLKNKTDDEVEAEIENYLVRHKADRLFRPDSWERSLVTQCKTKFSVKPQRADAILFYSQLPDGSVDPMSEHGACPVIAGEKWGANVWVWNGPRKGYTQRNRRTGEMELDSAGKQLSSWGWYKKQAPSHILSQYIKQGDDTTSYSSSDTRTDNEDDDVDPMNASEEYGFPPKSILVTFVLEDKQYAKLFLYWEDTYFGEIQINQPTAVNSYPGHVWYLKTKTGDKTLATWKVREYTQDELHTPHSQPTQVFVYKVNIPDEMDDIEYDEL